MKTRKHVYCSPDCERAYCRQFRSGRNHPRYLNSLLLPDFTQEQKDIILGTVMGDGCLLLNSNGNVHLQVAHSVKQRPYLEYKHGLLTPFARPINVHRRFDARYNRTYETHRFHTVCHPWLTQLRLELYGTGKKELPLGIIERITPRVLAFWFMDDGHCERESTFSICTVSFSPLQVIHAAHKLAEFGLKAWEKKGRLFISAHSKYTLIDLIGHLVPESMRYKLGSGDKQPRLF